MLRLRSGDEGRQLSGVAPAGGLLRGLRLIRLWLVVRLVLRAALVIRIRLLAAVRLGLLAWRVGLLLVVETLRRVETLLVAEIGLSRLLGLALHGLSQHRLALRRLAAVLVAVEALFGDCAGRGWRLIVGILRPELLLGGGDQTQIVFGVLEVVFGGDGVTGALGVAGKLQILFGNVVRSAADLHLGAVRFVDPG